MQQEVYPKDQNVNLPIQEPYDFNYKNPYGDFHHSTLLFDQLCPQLKCKVCNPIKIWRLCSLVAIPYQDPNFRSYVTIAVR